MINAYTMYAFIFLFCVDFWHSFLVFAGNILRKNALQGQDKML